jgi:hypothetical protein
VEEKRAEGRGEMRGKGENNIFMSQVKVSGEKSLRKGSVLLLSPGGSFPQWRKCLCLCLHTSCFAHPCNMSSSLI